MRTSALDVTRCGDGTVVVGLHGDLGQEAAVELRQVLVHAVRKIRPTRLVLDLADVSGVDPLNLGTVAAACQLGDDHGVLVMVVAPSAELTDRLTAAGVPHQRLRQATISY